MLLATAPAQGEDAALNAMFVRVGEDTVDVLDRNVVVATAPRSEVESSACTEIRSFSDADRTTAEFVGLTDDERSSRAPGNSVETCGRRSSASSATSTGRGARDSR